MKPAAGAVARACFPARCLGPSRSSLAQFVLAAVGGGRSVTSAVLQPNRDSIWQDAVASGHATNRRRMACKSR